MGIEDVAHEIVLHVMLGNTFRLVLGFLHSNYRDSPEPSLPDRHDAFLVLLGLWRGVFACMGCVRLQRFSGRFACGKLKNVLKYDEKKTTFEQNLT